MAGRTRQFAPPTQDERAAVMSVTMQMRMDIVSNLEQRRPVPVYFEACHHMEAYCEANELTIVAIRGVQMEDSVLIRHTGTRVGYGLVWVKATTRQPDVRKAMVNHIVDAYGLEEATLSPVDADHIVNRASLRQVPDAWVTVMPVFYEVNRRSGFILEKGLEIDRLRSKIYPNPLHIFKILSDTWPRNVEEYEQAMRKIEGQHQLPHLTSEIRNWIAKAFPFTATETRRPRNGKGSRLRKD